MRRGLSLVFIFFMGLSPLLFYGQEMPTDKDREEEPLAPSQEELEDITDLLKPDIVRDFDIPIVLNDAVEYYVTYFTTEKREVFSRWLKRSRLYIPLMKEVLRREGLPEDLVYLAMVESGFNPKAHSPKRACGPWQFIAETGKRYGLKVDYWRDERRDFEKSTIAAARYLKDLFDQFGCWFLAQAAYNAGERRLERAIRTHETQDFWELAKYSVLPAETRAFVPKIIAAAIIAKNPEAFGFEGSGYEEPMRFKKWTVRGGIPLKTIAQAAGIETSELRRLNPEILRGITPPAEESYVLRLPDTVEEEVFEERLGALLKNSKVYSHLRPYRLKKKESIASVLRRHGVSYEDLALVNGVEGSFKVKRGSIIYIPLFCKDRGAGKRVEGGLRGASYRRTLFYHRVRRGETLSSIALRYGVAVEEIKRLNRIGDSDTIRVGAKLKIRKK